MGKEKVIGGAIITAFIMIALLIAVVTNNQQGQRLVNVDNETISITGNQTGNLVNTDIQSITTLLNTTTLEDVTALCNVTLSTGGISCDDLSLGGSETLISNYTYFPATYVKETSSRTMVLLISFVLIIGTIVLLIKKQKIN